MQRNQSSGMESWGAVQWIHRYDNIDLWYDCADGMSPGLLIIAGVPDNPSSSIICIWHWGNWMLFQNSRWEYMMAGPIFTIRLIAASLWPMNMVISSTGQQRLLTTRYSMRLWLKQSARQRKRRIYIRRLLIFAVLIYFSAIPWIDYVSMTLPVITNPYGSGNQTYNTVSLLDGENMFLKVIDVECPCIWKSAMPLFMENH